MSGAPMKLVMSINETHTCTLFIWSLRGSNTECVEHRWIGNQTTGTFPVVHVNRELTANRVMFLSHGFCHTILSHDFQKSCDKNITRFCHMILSHDLTRAELATHDG